ncbi:MAG: hypothetical protein KDK61_01590, partial [Simkania sp.]|nr:hypothetical protein [Simkania sp.]
MKEFNGKEIVPHTRDNTNPRSIQMALDSGLFYWKGKTLKPKSDSGIAEALGHTKDHNAQSFVQAANKPDNEAIRCGGTPHTLQELANALNRTLEEPSLPLRRLAPPSRLPKKEKSPGPVGGYKQHLREIHLSSLDKEYFRYFEEHGIESPKDLLAKFGVSFTTLTSGTYKGHSTFVFKLSNESFKYFILNNSFQIQDKRSNAR